MPKMPRNFNPQTDVIIGKNSPQDNNAEPRLKYNKLIERSYLEASRNKQPNRDNLIESTLKVTKSIDMNFYTVNPTNNKLFQLTDIQASYAIKRSYEIVDKKYKPKDKTPFSEDIWSNATIEEWEKKQSSKRPSQEEPSTPPVEKKLKPLIVEDVDPETRSFITARLSASKHQTTEPACSGIFATEAKLTLPPKGVDSNSAIIQWASTLTPSGSMTSYLDSNSNNKNVRNK